MRKGDKGASRAEKSENARTVEVEFSRTKIVSVDEVAADLKKMALPKKTPATLRLVRALVC